MSKATITGKIETRPCPCGDEVCRKTQLSIGPYQAGAGFEPEVAERLRDCWNGCDGLNPEAYREVVEAANIMLNNLGAPKLSPEYTKAVNDLDVALAKARGKDDRS